MNKEIKVVHCCTYAEAHSAHIRLHKALLKYGIDSKVISLKEPQETFAEVYSIRKFGKKYQKYQKMSYYLNILNYWILSKIFGLKNNNPYNLGIFGIDISRIDLIREADVIHLHWINDCFLSLRCLKKLVSLNKPMVITLHDSWFLTGGCHVLNGCDNFEKKCEECPQLAHMQNISSKMFSIKKKILQNANVTLIAPGQWTYQNVLRSNILNDKKCTVIGNTLDYSIFDILNNNKEKEDVMQKERIKVLFGAINGTKAPHKGFNYLLEMLTLLKQQYPCLAQKIELNIFGSNKSKFSELEGYDCCFWGYIRDEKEMVELYNACDVYIVPSLEDSFNQTVLESCACGTPVVSFQTGGICDIIKHKETGYLAEYKNAFDLLNGLIWVINNNKYNCIGINARKLSMEMFSGKKVFEQYLSIYKNMLCL